jgi:DNA-directed RNA polymerase subunit RPC12/RpoP
MAAAKAGEAKEARFYLEWALRLGPGVREQTQAWFWLSEISEDPAEKRQWLEMVLASEPAHPLARRRLALLDGTLKPEEVIDPDRLGAQKTVEVHPEGARRFLCPQCGGRMAFTPDGSGLACDSCGHCEGQADAGGGAERDFTVSMAKAEGHVLPVQVPAVRCRGCGAEFALTSASLSFTCPYCWTAYVGDGGESKDLIPPGGIVPFGVSRSQAEARAAEWLAARYPKARLTELGGVYLPAWSFHLSGQLRWSGRIYDRFSDSWRAEEGSEVVLEDDMLVLGTRSLPEAYAKEIDGFALTGLARYDPGYVADWPAEMPAIPMSDAALVARAKTAGRTTEQLRRRLAGEVKDLRFDTSGFTIDTYELILLPHWIGHARERDHPFLIIVNGQNGSVWDSRSGGDRPRFPWPREDR